MLVGISRNIGQVCPAVRIHHLVSIPKRHIIRSFLQIVLAKTREHVMAEPLRPTCLVRKIFLEAKLASIGILENRPDINLRFMARDKGTQEIRMRRSMEEPLVDGNVKEARCAVGASADEGAARGCGGFSA